MLGSWSTVPSSLKQDSTRPTVVVSEQRVSRGEVCDGGLHEVKKSRDFGLNPLLNPDYLIVKSETVYLIMVFDRQHLLVI
jgi:hypothetical protein